MSEKTILITTPSLDASKNVSGVSSVTKFIINNNRNKHYKPFLLGRADNEKRNLIWALKILLSTLKWMFTIPSRKIEVIHFNFAFSRASVIRDVPLVLYARLIKKRMIIHLHGGEYLIEKEAPKWGNFFLKKILSGNIPVIVLSPIEEEAVKKRYHAGNVKVLPNCVDLEIAKAFKRSYSDDPGGVIKMLFIGRIRINKGIEVIYQALKELKDQGILFKFYMAGAGPDEVEYVEKFSKLLANDFEFKGVVSGTAKDDLFKSSDVFLLPSTFPEGLPMAMLESMAFGLIPIVSNIGSINYAVKNNENGIMLSENYAHQIAEAIKKLISDKDLARRLSETASNYIFKNYDPEKYISELNSIYASTK